MNRKNKIKEEIINDLNHIDYTYDTFKTSIKKESLEHLTQDELEHVWEQTGEVFGLLNSIMDYINSGEARKEHEEMLESNIVF